MAEINEAFTGITNIQNNVFSNVEYFFSQRRVNEEQEVLDKSLTRKNKQISIQYNFLAIHIPNVMSDTTISGLNIEIFGDCGYHYKGFMTNYQGIIPHFLIPLKGDKKIFVNITSKKNIENTNTCKTIYGGFGDGQKKDIETSKNNYVAFIDIPKKYQNVDTNTTNQLINESENE
jgi:hypothetical protein